MVSMSLHSRWSGLVLTYLCQFLLLLSPARGQNATDQRTELHILYITSSGGEYNSSGTIPAIEIALEQINNHPNVLPNYRLMYELGDSQCDAMVAQREFFRAIIRGEPKIAVVGAGCSIATESVAEVSQFWNITHFSYASSTTSLNSRKIFPNFWRTYPSEDNLAKAVMAIIQQYNWKQLKIITQDETLFTATSEILTRDLTEADIFVDQNGTTLFHSDENVANTEDLFSPEIRVYFLNMYSIHARRVMCAAAQATPTDELYYPSYVWITLGWYADRWWTQEVANDPTVNCTDAQFETLLRRTLAIQQLPTAENRTGSTNVSLTEEEFFDLYKQRLNETSYSFESTAHHAYDAIWALSFAIDRALPQLGANLTLEDFDYPTTAASISEIVQQQLNSSDFSFTGVSGLVTFNENGTRIATQPAQVLQYRNSSRSVLCGKLGPTPLERVTIGIVNSEGQFNYTDCDNDTTTWPAGIPFDGTPEEIVSSIDPGLFITYVILTSLGILFAIFCLFFNIIFKKSTIIRRTSPNLNYVIIAGAIMLYSSVYFFVVPSTDKLTIAVFCQLRVWLQSVGYFLCFGTIVAKMWRVYYIFHNPTPKKKYIPKDWHLFLATVALTLVSMIILMFEAILDDYTAKKVPNKGRDSTRNADRLLVNYAILKCDGKNSIIWIIILYGYVALTQVVAVILAFRTRKVKMKALNDAKYIAIIIYLTTVILTMMIIGAITLEDFINADAGVFGGGLIVFTTAVLVLIFIPKMVILYKDPRGEDINCSYSPSHSTSSGEANNAEREWLVKLEKHCRNLEGRLSKYECVETLRSNGCTHNLLSSSKHTLAFQNTMVYLNRTSTAVDEDSEPSISIAVSNGDGSSKRDKIPNGQESNSEAVDTTIPL